ncbi:hypothetical protein AB5J72_46150 [Streptomyces sp. CG1]|uniref:hypothetical protein n=1 Tax=Streptomyces sp. CG1 TaxID=1287523 RepID=UPI0034E290F6
MPQRHQSGTPEPGCGEAALPWADLPNAVLIAKLRMPATSKPTDRGPSDPRTRRKQIAAAAAELRRRRLPALLDYAVLFAAEASVQALALEALQRAVRDIRTAPGSDQPPPHHPFLLVEWTARLWAGTSVRRELSTDFLAWLDRTTHVSPSRPSAERSSASVGAVSRAYHRLPRRAQAILWHAAVERNDALAVGRSLDVHPDRVPHLGRSALEDFRQAYLRLYAERSDNGYCRRFTSLLEAATRRRGAYPSDDLDRHVAVCCDCARAYSVLAGMNKWPGAVLATALLPWGGAAFAIARRRRTTTVAATAPAEPMPTTIGHAPPHTEAPPARPWLRQVAHRAPAVAVTAAAGLLAAAATAITLPANDHNTGAAVPAPGGSPQTAPLPTAPSRSAPPDRSDGTRRISRAAYDKHRAGAEGHAHGQAPGPRQPNAARHGSSDDPGPPAPTHPQLTGIPSGSHGRDATSPHSRGCIRVFE